MTIETTKIPARFCVFEADLRIEPIEDEEAGAARCLSTTSTVLSPAAALELERQRVADAERRRVLGIVALAKPGQEQIRAECLEQGLSVEASSVRLLEHRWQKQRRCA